MADVTGFGMPERHAMVRPYQGYSNVAISTSKSGHRMSDAPLVEQNGLGPSFAYHCRQGGAPVKCPFPA
jgi:hypothetical protein